MQILTVPKEVIWVTRLLWLDIMIRLIIVAILVSISAFGIEEKFVRILMVLPKTMIWALVLLATNYFLLKGNKWAMRFMIILIASVMVSNIVAFSDAFTADNEIMNQVMYGFRILLGLLIVYLLLKQKDFFNKKISSIGQSTNQ